MELTTTEARMYNYMAQEFYKEYYESQRVLEEYKKESTNTGFLDRSKQLNLRNNVSKNSISCIIFLALSIEAYVNFFGSVKLGHSNFVTHYEKISTVDKLIVLTKAGIGKEFPKGDNIYQKVKRVFYLRNQLVHPKSQHYKIPVDLTTSKKLFALDYDIKENIDSYINVFEELREVMKKLEETDKDVIDEEYDKLMSNIHK